MNYYDYEEKNELTVDKKHNYIDVKQNKLVIKDIKVEASSNHVAYLHNINPVYGPTWYIAFRPTPITNREVKLWKNNFGYYTASISNKLLNEMGITKDCNFKLELEETLNDEIIYRMSY